MTNSTILKPGEIFYFYFQGTSIPYFYIGRGKVCGENVEMFVEAQGHSVDPLKEIRVVGIRGDLRFTGKKLPNGSIPNVAESFSPNRKEYSMLIEILRQVKVPLVQ